MKSLVLLTVVAMAMSLSAQTSDTLSIKSGEVNLHAVLSQPTINEDKCMALIIAGSGPTDLNGNQPGLQNNSLLYLSQALVENNVATLRFDKRGIAQSAYTGFDESELRIEDFADDVNTLLSYCKDNGYKKIYVIGHSEGSLIGLLAVQKTNVSGFVSLCGAGNPADVVIKNQLHPKLPPAMYEQTESIIDSLKQGDRVNNVPPQFFALFRPSVQNYLISWFKYSPAELMTKLSCPALVVQGEKDLQVGESEALRLAKATSQGQVELIENMNHVLKTISGDIQENMASYRNPELPVNKELIAKVVEFINERR